VSHVPRQRQAVGDDPDVQRRGEWPADGRGRGGGRNGQRGRNDGAQEKGETAAPQEESCHLSNVDSGA